MIEFNDVSKQYKDGTYAVKSFNAVINKGEFFVIIGPSGSGKTTTLKMINRLIELSGGTISINGQKISEYDIHELRWNIGYVLQQIALFPNMNIEENIAVVPELKKWNRETIKQRVNELLEMVGLDPEIYRERKPHELSGGQQQRIGVVRALAADPEMILMDEPFSALDPMTKVKLQDDMLDLQRRIQKTIVFVTHDIQEALKLGDRICIMNNGEIVQIGTPDDILYHPANDFVRDFVGVQEGITNEKMNLEDIVQQTEVAPSNPFETVSVTTSLQEILDKLTHHDQVFAERNGEMIGVINRQAFIQYLAEHVQKRGHMNE
ncbi:glycine/betaine ABC transporter ATP-binding protein [Bacillus nakamurai]|uniref:Quaternary amine transport ATP-binding protein n=1 Tax=Bacillus nakamurai TaxID=1793963 RepID=A0A150F827_9BACI|nr:ABC transporter ATP-binding protein [Bacillus nakamurai]KXZ20498.1 glycine/betaine ABC transporter ATP-binding protein [Bacillus nakamurai]KXZ23872.1 glycine/betaine ABC transporter ATP-binding protein [Bacillus nakamurai]MCC9024414.1 ABC transporter ATP-binding protein [Bacillus nakamurai]MED1229861.1 ABC transporter ATP-binding protein [Bacillus nakamurai]